jgi:hypothetical protein
MLVQVVPTSQHELIHKAHEKVKASPKHAVMLMYKRCFMLVPFIYPVNPG